jgi:hypothetical protein
VDSLKSAAKELHQRARWRDWRGFVELIVEDRRGAFLAARKNAHDSRDLSITDYEVLDVRMKEGNVRGDALTRMSWLQLPSVTERTEEVWSHWEFMKGTWYLDSMEGGPFAQDLAP